jgi:RNA polymerase sigma-70 factor (ECF subfamily)
VADLQETIDDAVQETCKRALEKTGDFLPASGSPTAWIHGILNKVLLENSQSRPGRQTQLPDNPAAWERLAVDLTRAHDDVVADRLDALSYLSRLPVNQRNILELRYRDNLDHSEIAARLGLSPGAARVRLCRALAALKEIAGLGPEEDGQ